MGHRILFEESTQQTRDVVLMLGQCWASVVDGGTALAQHRDNVSCLLGSLNNYRPKDRCSIYRPIGYKMVYLPHYKVADTPFHIQEDELLQQRGRKPSLAILHQQLIYQLLLYHRIKS